MGNIGIHSRKEQRFICHECHKTFSARKGTVFYRLRTSAETVVLVVTLLAHGCPLQAIVAAFGFDERTVAAWWARSSRQGQAVQEYLILMLKAKAESFPKPGHDWAAHKAWGGALFGGLGSPP